MDIIITNCEDKRLFINDIGATIINDGSLVYGEFAWNALSHEKIVKNSVVALDVEEITEKIVGVIIIDESDLYIDMSLAYVICQYRKKGIFKLMFERVKDYASTVNKTIRFYCDKSLCEIYKKCGCEIDENLEVMVLKPQNN